MSFAVCLLKVLLGFASESEIAKHDRLFADLPAVSENTNASLNSNADEEPNYTAAVEEVLTSEKTSLLSKQQQQQEQKASYYTEEDGSNIVTEKEVVEKSPPSTQTSKFKIRLVPLLKTTLIEIAILLNLALPIIMCNIAFAIMTAINTAFVGHLDDPAFLASAAVANSFVAITLFLAIGIASALDTLVSQASMDKSLEKEIPHYLWRALVMLTLLTAIIAAVYAISHVVFGWMGIEHEIAFLSRTYLLWMIIGLWPNFISRGLLRFLNSLNILLLPMIAILICVPLNLLLNILITEGVGYKGLGFIGAPISISVASWFMLILMAFLTIFYAYKRNMLKSFSSCFSPLDFCSINGVFQFMMLAIPGSLMLVLESLAFEATSVFASRLGTIPLAAHSAALNIAFTIFMIPLGVSIAASIRVGMMIGANDIKRAKFAGAVSVGLAVACGLCVSLTIAIFGDYVGRIFTKDEGVLQEMHKFMFIVAGYQILDFSQTAIAGVLRGVGYQKIGAIFNIFGYYLVAIPLALLLTFKASLGLVGLWLGLASGLAFILVSYIISLIFFVKWKKVEEKTG